MVVVALPAAVVVVDDAVVEEGPVGGVVPPSGKVVTSSGTVVVDGLTGVSGVGVVVVTGTRTAGTSSVWGTGSGRTAR